MDIKVRKINESISRIVCNSGIAQEISEYFSFFAPGYKFSPKYKSRIWDGKIRLAKLLPNYDLEFPIGLLSHLEIFCTDRQYSIETIESDINNYDREYIINYINSLNIHSNNKKIEIRDYQLESIINYLNTKRQVLLSPTSCLDSNTLIDIELTEEMIEFLKT